MSEVVIRGFEKKDIPEIRDIFFESSTRKNFKDESERGAFYQKYVGHYLEHFPEFALVAVSGEKVLGYVLGAPRSDAEDLYVLQPHMRLFQQYFTQFPAHLHINCHHEARGLGVGSKLLREFEKLLQQAKIRGLHIMTGPDSQNRLFYKKNGFSDQVELNFQGGPILLMGKEYKVK